MNMWKNKLYAVTLLALGLLIMLLGQDATAFLILALIAVPMFVSKKNWIVS